MSGADLVLVAYDQTATQGVADSVVKYLRRDHGYEVLLVGPGHGEETLLGLRQEVRDRARFFLELDAVSGVLHHAHGLERLTCPKLAWFVDSHKKPHFHHSIAREFDLVFFTMWAWSGLFGERGRWLPVHYDPEWIGPRPIEPEVDVGFVGSRPHERSGALQEIARRHGLTLLLETTTGPREKELTADLYARCRVVFNQHVANDLNFRMVEALACRRLLVTDAQRNGQYELFRDREHLVYYKDDRDLEAVLLHYLRRPDERERIAAAGHDLVSCHHTTPARVAELVAAAEELVRGRGGSPRGGTHRLKGDEASPGPSVLLLAGSLDSAGPADRAAAVAAALGGEGVEVDLVALAAPPVEFPARVHLARGPRLPVLPGAPRARALLENVPLLDAADLLLRLRARTPDLVVALQLEHALAARSLGAPFAVVLGPEHPEREDVEELASAAAILVVSAEVGEALLRLDPGLAPRVQLVPDAMSLGASVGRLVSQQAISPAALRVEVEVRDERAGGGPAPDVSVLLVCCDRPDVLEVTLETTRAALVGAKPTIEWLAFDNGSGPEVQALLDEAGLDVLLRAPENQGLAPALDALYRASRGRYLLTLEDDWACLALDHGWLELAVGILDSQPDVGVVRLRQLDDGQCGHFKRHRRDVALRHHPWSVEPLPDVVETRELGGERFYVAGAAWANWTHNPTLCRRAVKDWIGAVSAYLPDPRDHRPRDDHPGLEGAIDLRWRTGPWMVAKLLQGPFTHIGDRQPARVAADAVTGAPA